MFYLVKLQQDIVPDQIEVQEESNGMLIPLFLAIVLIGLFFFLKNKKSNLNEKPKNPFIHEISLLSIRERQVFDEILKNKSLKEIAETLFIEVSTVKSHANKIYKLFAVKNKRELLSKLLVDN